MSQDRTLELMKTHQATMRAVTAVEKLITEQFGDSAQIRAAFRAVRKTVDNAEMEREVIKAAMDDFAAAFSRVSRLRDEAYRDRNIAYRYVKNQQNNEEWERLIFVLDATGYTDL